MTTSFEPRAVCLRCMRPQRVCYCPHLVSLPTQTKVVILQHPREQHMPIGTAHMAHLCLPNSELLVGVDFDGDPKLQALLQDAERPAVVLYPSDDARDLRSDPPAGPCTLIVLDGTWWQARKLLRANASLQALPKVAFVPDAPSEYRIRREPQDEYVSTIEALATVLPCLERTPAERFDELRKPFRAMIDRQLECEATLPNQHPRVPRTRQKPRKSSLAKLQERAADLVCVAVEASAWPRPETPRPPAERDDELVYLTALRVATGERLTLARAPRKGLAPHTQAQTGLGPSTLAAGLEPAAFVAAVREFLRPNDALCTWGDHPQRLLEAIELGAEHTRFDVRQVARDRAQGKVGALGDVCRALGTEPEQLTPLGEGRAGVRLAELAAVTSALCTISRERTPRRERELQPRREPN